MDPTSMPPGDRPHEPGRTGSEAPGRSWDPAAVALANASLLGAGYMMLRRRRPAVVTVVITIVLVAVLALGVRTVWFEAVVLAWWAAVVVHGWYLAGGRPRRSPSVPAGPGREAVRRQRLVALGIAGPVLLAVGFLRFDASRIERDAAAAHRQGECARALSILDGLWAGHHVADAPLTARAERGAEACELLLTAERQAGRDPLLAARTLQAYGAHPSALWASADGRRAELFLARAADELDAALTGDTKALETGFGRLSTVLGQFPGQEGNVQNVMNGFLGHLPADNPCATRAITDWLGERPAAGDVLDGAAGVVPELAPAAILGCGDDLVAAKDWKEARAQYEQLLDQYPKHDLAAKAERGRKKAQLAIELANVRKLLKKPESGGKPAYCTKPARYSGAKPYRGKGPHRALFFGKDDHRRKLPSSWLAKDAADAVLVICAGKMTYGSAVTSCDYRAQRSGWITRVTFRKRKVPVRVYELRTGRRVAAHSVQIGGTSCPRRIHYTIFGSFDPGPPSKRYVSSSTSDVRAGYRPLIRP
ncbi:hypothetical protein FH608_039925 [Nonomuraea phyllanthi]|uniref:Tetratricopeptide repeat protein n=1 Tax=Nonomuraea phyllanthi TaxID=2219224 RepID=A0A5C4VM37_9ACTN|nr:hypothetical protein [Nonomuraea phyllanthi]KAB8189373.1 hypothetical protein FH608_039925 [Nonomuraea phyllanthi]